LATDLIRLLPAVGVFAAVAIVPVSLAFDAVSSWREYGRVRVGQRAHDLREGT